jgi:hypothetical protein
MIARLLIESPLRANDTAQILAWEEADDRRVGLGPGIEPSPPLITQSRAIRSSGNGGCTSGLTANLSRSSGLSSPAERFRCRTSHPVQR